MNVTITPVVIDWLLWAKRLLVDVTTFWHIQLHIRRGNCRRKCRHKVPTTGVDRKSRRCCSPTLLKVGCARSPPGGRDVNQVFHSTNSRQSMSAGRYISSWRQTSMSNRKPASVDPPVVCRCPATIGGHVYIANLQRNCRSSWRTRYRLIRG